MVKTFPIEHGSQQHADLIQETIEKGEDLVERHCLTDAEADAITALRLQQYIGSAVIEFLGAEEDDPESVIEGVQMAEGEYAIIRNLILEAVGYDEIEYAARGQFFALFAILYAIVAPIQREGARP